MCLITSSSSKPTNSDLFSFNFPIKLTENELQMSVASIAEYAIHPAAGCLPRIYFIPVSTEVYHPATGLFTKKLSLLERICRVFA
jgi:hypothetical protein